MRNLNTSVVKESKLRVLQEWDNHVELHHYKVHFDMSYITTINM